MRRILYLATMALPFFVGGCAESFVNACLREAKNPSGQYKYTEQEANVVCAKAQLYAIPHLTPYNEETKRHELNPNGLLIKDVKEVLGDEANSINNYLSYTSRQTARNVDWWRNFRASLEKEEKVVLARINRLSLAQTYDEFVEKVGELPDEFQMNELQSIFPEGRKFYSQRLGYPYTTFESLRFTAPYLEEARQNGLLQQVESFDFEFSMELGKKVADLRDPNMHHWEPDHRVWHVRSYKILEKGAVPPDNKVHYIEVYRGLPKNEGGDEDKPAVRGFLASSGSEVSIFVLDQDQKGASGYGYPDAVVEIFTGVKSAQELFYLPGFRQQVLDPLYGEAKTKPWDDPKRVRPAERDPYIEIAKVGEVTVELWQSGEWSVPFDYHSSSSQKIEIAYSTIVDPDARKRAEREKVQQIEGFKLSYSKNSNLVALEYWLPKEKYAKLDVASATAFTETIRVRRKNGPEETGEVGYFAERIKRIEYKYGDRWFAIVDEDGDGVFEKKREIGDRSAANVSSGSPDGGPY